MYIFIFIIALTAFILLSKINIHTGYAEKKFELTVDILGIKVFDSKKKKKTSDNNLKKTGENKKEKFTIEKLKEYINKITKIFPDAKNILKYFKRKVKAKEFKFDLTFGMLDAAETGIATGMIWAAIGTFYPAIDSAIEIKDPVINVNPKFNCEYFDVEYKGIYQVRIFHILYIALMSMKIILKYKNGGA